MDMELLDYCRANGIQLQAYASMGGQVLLVERTMHTTRIWIWGIWI
jgi:diketogulonate reductase-like aldo/keto reductase